MKLPPVPESGTYELRLGTSNNELRTMVTVYLGDSPYNAQPVGLPIDQREAVSNIPGNPWKQDTGDEETDRENDRNLRNQGYMKGRMPSCPLERKPVTMVRMQLVVRPKLLLHSVVF